MSQNRSIVVGVSPWTKANKSSDVGERRQPGLPSSTTAVSPQTVKEFAVTKLDVFSRIELGTYYLGAVAVALGLPALVAWLLILWLVPADWPALMRYGTATGGAIVGWILAIIAMFLADGAFKGTRRIFKMRTLAEAESERADPGDTFIAERPSNGPSSTLVRKNFFINSLLVAVFVFVIWSLLQVSTGERLGSAAAPAGIFVLYMVVSSLVNRVMWHMQETRKELDQLHSRLAALSSAVNWRYDYRKDETRCANCSEERSRHAAGGRCPPER